MSLLQIKTFPESILKEKSKPVKDINGNIQKLINDMIETMYAAPGIGLAAPQIGVLQKLTVIDINTDEESHPLIVLINPQIVHKEDEIDSEEGCLSLPDFRSHVRRAKNVCVKGYDREGKPIELEATGLLSRALQHEIDHLDGLLIFDKIGPIRKKLFLKRYMKALKRKN